MFKMRNNLGNVVIEIKTARQCEDLKRCGYITVEENPDFDKMKTEELEAFAEKNGINLKNCKNKTEKLIQVKKSFEN